MWAQTVPAWTRCAQTVPAWDYVGPDSPSLKIQPACGALSRRLPSRRGTLALLANTTSTWTAKADERSREPQGQDCNQTFWEEATVATETKHLHWPLACSTLALPTPALASCLCGSPSVDTSLHAYAAATHFSAWAQQQPTQSLRRRQTMLQPTLGSTSRALARGIRQGGPLLRHKACGRRHEARRTPPIADRTPPEAGGMRQGGTLPVAQAPKGSGRRHEAGRTPTVAESSPPDAKGRWQEA